MLRSFLSWLFSQDEPLSTSTLLRIRSDSEREERVRELTPIGRRRNRKNEPEGITSSYDREVTR